mmetsp:Transcript_43408/g.101361  ORF Transcript_43408/g.101361 Transcript_43408/m.101361 type:complete len:113 (+) Transcript_43408:182-520(+)
MFPNSLEDHHLASSTSNSVSSTGTSCRLRRQVGSHLHDPAILLRHVRTSWRRARPTLICQSVALRRGNDFTKNWHRRVVRMSISGSQTLVQAFARTEGETAEPCQDQQTAQK